MYLRSRTCLWRATLILLDPFDILRSTRSKISVVVPVPLEDDPLQQTAPLLPLPPLFPFDRPLDVSTRISAFLSIAPLSLLTIAITLLHHRLLTLTLPHLSALFLLPSVQLANDLTLENSSRTIICKAHRFRSTLKTLRRPMNGHYKVLTSGRRQGGGQVKIVNWADSIIERHSSIRFTLEMDSNKVLANSRLQVDHLPQALILPPTILRQVISNLSTTCLHPQSSMIRLLTCKGVCERRRYESI